MKIHVVISPSFFLFPPLSVLCSASLSLAFLFVHSSVLLPVDSWLSCVHHVSSCQICTNTPIGSSSAELEWRSECPGSGWRTALLCCWWLLPDMAWAFSSWWEHCLYRSVAQFGPFTNASSAAQRQLLLITSKIKVILCLVVIWFGISLTSHTSLLGMGAFAVAHLLYALTFLSSHYATHSSSYWRHFLYLILFMLGGGFYTYLYPFLQKAQNSDLLIPAVGIYVFLISLMGTLAIRTCNMATLLGSLSFIVSDMSLSLQLFKVIAPMKHGNTLVMGTYYLAQLLIAIGDVKAVENKNDFAKWKRS